MAKKLKEKHIEPPRVVIKYRQKKEHHWKYDTMEFNQAIKEEKRIGNIKLFEIVYDTIRPESKIIPPISYEAGHWNLQLITLITEAHLNKHLTDFLTKYAKLFKDHWEQRKNIKFDTWGMGYATYLETVAGIDEKLIDSMENTIFK